MGAAPLPRLCPAGSGRGRGAGVDDGEAPARPRCRPERRLPVARPAVAVHGAHRRVWQRRARSGPPARSSARIGVGHAPALHTAATDGDVALVRLLLELGADPDMHDARFDATPLGWARHFEQAETIAALEPVTRADPGE